VPSITIRNVPEDVHRAIRVRAALRGRSAEAEIRDILAQAAKPAGRLKLGSMLSAIALEAGGLTAAEALLFERVRDRTPAKPIKFE
jgi:antitoxin FitA